MPLWDNDDYHEPVSVVDKWAEYHRLNKEAGMTQDQIAEVKTVSQFIWFLQLGFSCFSFY